MASFDSCRANDNGPAITGITLDSRQVRPGDLYVGLHGLHAHGASFAASAVESGAVAVLTDEDGAILAAEAGVPIIVVDDPRAAM
ncbi:UDP-N-acetylmuramoyl-L-alanyl-D-glutamate--2,6-diaminopimelate ligase, partial [Xanthomonas citri pv. citri]|nr:UDP-N-acetylmuramoyl-L-alanyl-D-glutamate--2,6-diaminopimelate ligase [Xanthomonas citri pv. citri]